MWFDGVLVPKLLLDGFVVQLCESVLVEFPFCRCFGPFLFLSFSLLILQIPFVLSLLVEQVIVKIIEPLLLHFLGHESAKKLVIFDLQMLQTLLFSFNFFLFIHLFNH